MPNAGLFGGVTLSQRQEDRVPNQLDNNGRIVAIVLDLVEFKKIQSDLVVNQLPIRGIFNVQR